MTGFTSTTAEPTSPGPSPARGVEQVDVPLRWIDEETPAGLPAGATLGAPLPRGVVHDLTDLGVVDADGALVPAQLWPLATWPDGSVKWTGIALGATDTASSRYRLTHGTHRSPDRGVRVTEASGAVEIDTGVLQVSVPRTGPVLVRE